MGFKITSERACVNGVAKLIHSKQGVPVVIVSTDESVGGDKCFVGDIAINVGGDRALIFNTETKNGFISHPFVSLFPHAYVVRPMRAGDNLGIEGED